MVTRQNAPIHPGEILQDELTELDITPSELARQIDVPPCHVVEILDGKRAITGDVALRLGHWFDMDPIFWLRLQNQFDLETAEIEVGAAVRALPTAAR